MDDVREQTGTPEQQSAPEQKGTSEREGTSEQKSTSGQAPVGGELGQSPLVNADIARTRASFSGSGYCCSFRSASR